MDNIIVISPEEVNQRAEIVLARVVRSLAYDNLCDKGIYLEDYSQQEYESFILREMELVKPEISHDPYYSTENYKQRAFEELREEKYNSYLRSIGKDQLTIMRKWENETNNGETEYTDEENQAAETMLMEAVCGKQAPDNINELINQAKEDLS